MNDNNFMKSVKMEQPADFYSEPYSQEQFAHSLQRGESLANFCAVRIKNHLEALEQTSYGQQPQFTESPDLDSKDNLKFIVQKEEIILDDFYTGTGKNTHGAIKCSTSILNQTPGPSSVFQTDDSDNESSDMPTILNGKFFRILRSESEELSGSDNIIAICVKCQPNIVKIKGNKKATSNFISHLKRRHGQEIFDEYQSYKRHCHRRRIDTASRNVSREVVSKQTDKGQKTNVDKIVRFAIHSLVPLRVIKDPYFKEMFDNCQALPVFSQHQLECEIDKLYNCYIQETRSKLKSAMYVCTTADIWSYRKRSFFGVTAHWLTIEALKRKSVALACRRFKGTLKRSEEMLKEISTKYGIRKRQLVTTVTENGCNYAKAFEAFGVSKDIITCANQEEDLKSQEDDSEDDDINLSADCWTKTLPNHVRCSSHILNLCVSADFNRALLEDANLRKLHEEVILKCNTLWRFTLRLKSAEKLEEVLGHTLRRPVETRWNSLFLSLKQILEAKDKMPILAKELNINNFLSEHEFQYIAEYLKCTEPVANALDILQSEDIYFGILLPCMLTLQRKLKTLKSYSWVYCQTVANVLYDSVTTRFQNLLTFDTPESETAVIAALTYPKFKNKWFSLIAPEYHQRLLDLLKREMISENEQTKCTTVEQDPNQASQKDDEFFDFLTSSKDSNTETLLPAGELEVLKYLSDHDTRLDCLDKYPNVRKLFIKFNTPIPSSAPVQRLFSYATIINLLHSQETLGSNLEKRVILKSDLNKSQ